MLKKLVYKTFAFVSKILPVGVKKKITSGGALSGLLRKTLNATVEEGLSVVTITDGPLKGKQILLDMKNEKSRWLGTYEPELVEVIKKEIKPGMTVYDIGANIGYVAMIFAEFTGNTGQVLAFEPLPENVDRVQRNARMNKMDHLRVFEAAVIDENKHVIFLRHQSVGMGKAQGSAGRDDQQYDASLTVRGIQLDDFVFTKGNPKPDVIKLDIEGGEVMALPGMRRVLKELSPLMMIELHGEESEKVAWEVLNDCGYELFQMEDLSVKIGSVEELKWKAYVVARKKAQ